jgi:uncharacterized membrane protein
VCGFDNPHALNIHHVIPRCDPRSTNDNINLAILCHTCHDLVHAGDIIILGVFSSTALGGRTVVWHKKDQESPLDEIDWRVNENHMVLRKKNV